jgi:hypothetical protein
MTSNAEFTQPDTAPTRAPIGRPLRGTLPGPVTYVVLAMWSGVVMAAIVAGVLAGGGASRLLLPASMGCPSNRRPSPPGRWPQRHPKPGRAACALTGSADFLPRDLRNRCHFFGAGGEVGSAVAKELAPKERDTLTGAIVNASCGLVLD